MNGFVFTSRSTHSAYEFLLADQERLAAIVQGIGGGSERQLNQLTQELEDWIRAERPPTTRGFYDDLLERALLDVDFTNLATATQMWFAGRQERRSVASHA